MKIKAMQQFLLPTRLSLQEVNSLTLHSYHLLAQGG